jgi:hypothetical protein
MPGQTEHIFVRTGAHPRADLFQLAVRAEEESAASLSRAYPRGHFASRR